MFTWPTIFFKFNFRNGTKVLISLILSICPPQAATPVPLHPALQRNVYTFPLPGSPVGIQLIEFLPMLLFLLPPTPCLVSRALPV